MRGVMVDSQVVGGIRYEHWKTDCGKSNCKKCPHGPYWYRPQQTKQGLKYVYIGKDLVKGEERRQPWLKPRKLENGVPIPPCGVPGRCGCGRFVKEADVTRGSCSRCGSELTLAGLNVPCSHCGGRLPAKRLRSDGCPTCDNPNIPDVHADRAQFFSNPPATAGILSPGGNHEIGPKAVP